MARVFLGALGLMALSVGCGPASEPAFPATEQLGDRHALAPAGPRPGEGDAADRARLRFHMQRQFDDLRAVERLLIAGRLDEARSRSFLLSRPARDAGADQGVAGAAAVARVSAAALALSRAASLPEACRLEPRVAAACADCHRASESPPAPDLARRAPPAPPDEPSPAARMARHQWAADRLWEGMVGPSDRAWAAGLAVLAAAPLPSVPESAGLRLQAVAREALAAAPRADLAGRAQAYGELLVACTACHAAAASPPARTADPAPDAAARRGANGP